MAEPVVLLLDDDTQFRRCYAFAVQTELGVEVAAAASLAEARQLLEQAGDSVRAAIVDVRLARGEIGFDLVPELRRRRVYTLAVTGFGTLELARTALEVGCAWIYTKSGEELELLIRALANALRSEAETRPVDIPADWSLTDQECRVTALQYNGLRTENVAARLEITESTVRRYRMDVLAKTGIPYWECLLAYLRAWQAPRPPHQSTTFRRPDTI